MPGARLKTEEWYPIKFDGVAKDVVLKKGNGLIDTLRKDIAQEFTTKNGIETIDCTAMMVR
jgi:hypothetical protein